MMSKKEPKFTRTVNDLNKIKSGKLKRLLDIINKEDPDRLRPIIGPDGKAVDILDLIRKRRRSNDDDLE